MSNDSKTKVTVLTGHYRISGSIDLLPGARVTDFLSESRDFIALTDVDVWDFNGRRLFSGKFMSLNRDSIELIMPEDVVTQGMWRPPA